MNLAKAVAILITTMFATPVTNSLVSVTPDLQPRIDAIGAGVPLNMLSKWLGHSTLEVTAIYANATGAEEQGITARMWR